MGIVAGMKGRDWGYPLSLLYIKKIKKKQQIWWDSVE
jgi:hypothetical protein